MSSEEHHFPFISILLPARNEEEPLARCLSALEKQQYPAGKWEVLIGNDQSTDATGKIAASFTERIPHFRLMEITENVGMAKGKANVLAQLAQKAKGKWLLLTDADMQLPPEWAVEMVKYAESKQLDLLTGFTLVEGKSLFCQLQNAEWAMALSMIKLSNDAGFPVTAMGNNMLIRAEFYRKLGGYESMPFSITEDYALFKRVKDSGGRTDHLLTEEITGFTLPAKNWGGLLQQRKRWMHGAMQLPVFYRMVYWLQFIFLPILLVTFLKAPLLAVLVFSLKYLLTTGNLIRTFHRAKAPFPWKGILLFEFYQDLSPLIFIPFYYWPAATKWKGRSY